MTEEERTTLLWALPQIQACETLEDAFKLFHVIKDRAINSRDVGMFLLKRMGELGLESYSFAYAEVEEYFGFKTVWDGFFEARGNPECVSNYRGRES